jgi:hypothetical protein
MLENMTAKHLQYGVPLRFLTLDTAKFGELHGRLLSWKTVCRSWNLRDITYGLISWGHSLPYAGQPLAVTYSKQDVLAGGRSRLV